MRVHNHRIALNTRMANRFGNNRLHAKGPVAPCPNMGQGDATDTFKFIASSTDMCVAITNRYDTGARQFNPAVTGGTIKIKSMQVSSDWVRGCPLCVALHIVGCVPGEEVTVKLNPLGQCIPGFTLVFAMGIDPAGEVAPIRSMNGWGALPTSPGNTGDSMHFANEDFTIEAFWLMVTALPHRGPPHLYTSTPETTKLDAEICHGKGEDPVSIDPSGRWSGGWYSASFWHRLPDMTSYRGTWASCSWNRPEVEEYNPAKGYVAIQLAKGVKFTGVVPVTVA